MSELTWLLLGLGALLFIAPSIGLTIVYCIGVIVLVYFAYYLLYAIGGFFYLVIKGLLNRL